MIERVLPDRTMEERVRALVASARMTPQTESADAWREHFRWTSRRVSGGPPANVKSEHDYMARPDPLRKLP